MSMTETPFDEKIVEQTLAAKLAEVGLEVAYFHKGETNSGQGYKYASAEQILGRTNQSLFKRGICLQSSQELLKYELVAPEMKKVRAVVKTTWNFVDGSPNSKASYSAQGVGEGMDNGDKAVAKACTASVKYLIANVFCVSWGDDPEADASTDRDNKPVPSKVVKLPSVSLTVDEVKSMVVGDVDGMKKKIILLKSKLAPELYAEFCAAHTARAAELINA